jgi:type I restriction enzyme S subunit
VAELPPGWTTAALSEHVKWTSGGTPKRSIAGYFGPGLPWLSIADLNDAAVHTAAESLTDSGLANSAAKQLPPKTLVIAMYGSIGKLGVTTMPACTSQAIAAATELSHLTVRYLFHFLLHSRTKLQRSGRGNTQSNIGLGDLRRLTIPLPPVEEQRRIAGVLDHVDGLRAKRRDSIARLDALTCADLNKMIAEHAETPRVPLGSVATIKGGKRLPKGAEYSAAPTSNPYIRVTDLRGGTVCMNDLRYLTPDVHAKISRYTVAEDDVIISIAGSIGLVAPVPEELSGANLTENAAKISPTEPDSWDPIFLASALGTPTLQNQIKGQTGQVTISKLALFRIEKLALTLPPVDVQREFAVRARAIEGQRDLYRRELGELDRLFASLQARAFRGEL